MVLYPALSSGFKGAKAPRRKALRIFSEKIYKIHSKAFDTVPHNILIKKLNHYGIRGKINDWFSDYLSNRKQATLFENSLSSTKTTKLGVPQGSVLGPILFLLFINDLPNISKLLSTILFADDATLSLYGDNPTELVHLANKELYKFQLWCLANRLTVNTLKTFYILFSNRPPKSLPPLVIKSNNSYDLIQRVESVKFLGVYYDHDMTFKTHVTHLSQKLSRTASLFYRVNQFMPPFVLKLLYHAHVGSLLSYCNMIWANTYITHLDPVIKMQKRIIRIITNSDFLEHTEALFKQCRILKLENLRKYSLALHFYKNIDTLLPPMQPTHNYQTRFRQRPRADQHHRSIFEKSYLFQLPKIWNELLDACPDIVTNRPSVEVFKKHLKQHLISLNL